MIELDQANREHSNFSISRGFPIRHLYMIGAKHEVVEPHAQATSEEQIRNVSDQSFGVCMLVCQLQGFLQLALVLPFIFQLYFLFQSHENHLSLFREGR